VGTVRSACVPSVPRGRGWRWPMTRPISPSSAPTAASATGPRAPVTVSRASPEPRASDSLVQMIAPPVGNVFRIMIMQGRRGTV
jgi:hypothetical protein